MSKELGAGGRFDNFLDPASFLVGFAVSLLAFILLHGF